MCVVCDVYFIFFCFMGTVTSKIYMYGLPLSLPDALPIFARDRDVACSAGGRDAAVGQRYRRDQGGACAPAFAQGGDEALPRFALCYPRLRSQGGEQRRQ